MKELYAWLGDALVLSDWAAEAAMCGLGAEQQRDAVEQAAGVAFCIARNIDALAAEAPSSVARKLRGVVLQNSAALFAELGIEVRGARAILPERQVEIPFSMFPAGLAGGSLLDAFAQIKGEGSALRLCLPAGTALRTGQVLPPSYVDVPASAARPHGRLELPRETRLGLVDARIGMPCDEVVWGDLCDAARDNAPKDCALKINFSKSGGVHVSAAATSRDETLIQSTPHTPVPAASPNRNPLAGPKRP